MNQEGTNEKKKMNGADITATVVSVVLVFLFGLIGALICYGNKVLCYLNLIVHFFLGTSCYYHQN